MAVQKQDDQHEHTFSNYVRIWDVVQKTCLRRWTIGKSGERGSGISVLPARHDDDDDDLQKILLKTINMIESIWKQNFGYFLYQLETDAMKLARKLEKKYKFIKNENSVVSNQTYVDIYIVIHRQTVSFYQNSSVWLDTQDTRSQDRNLSNFTLDWLLCNILPGIRICTKYILWEKVGMKMKERLYWLGSRRWKKI